MLYFSVHILLITVIEINNNVTDKMYMQFYIKVILWVNFECFTYKAF